MESPRGPPGRLRRIPGRRQGGPASSSLICWLILPGVLVAAGAESLALFAVVDGLRHPRVLFPAGQRVIEVSYRLTDGRVSGVRYLPECAERRATIVALLTDPSVVDVSVQSAGSD